MQNMFASLQLIFDEYDRPVEVAYVGDEPCYVVDDAGFRRHIPSEQVDVQVMENMFGMIPIVARTKLRNRKTKVKKIAKKTAPNVKICETYVLRSV